MAKFKFHKVAAIVVTIGFAAWIATGQFSSVGSAQSTDEPKPAAAEKPKEAARTVAVVKPPRVEHSRAIRLSGHTEANQRVTLAARQAGVIGELPVKQGQTVAAGDKIMVLDAEEREAAVANAKALLSQRQAEADAAERLAKSGNLAKLQLDGARSALAAAKAQLEAAKADLSRNELIAPFAGVIDAVPVEQGAAVMAGAEIATVLNLDPILVKGEVSERDLHHIRVGDEAEVKLVDGKVVKGTLRYVSRDASVATRTFRVEIAIPNGEGAIPAGMTAEITLYAQPADAVLLPRSVVTLGQKGELGIRAVDQGNEVAFYPIDLVDDTPKGLVLAGIPADVRVIVAGQQLVTEGDVVNPVEATPEEVEKLVGEAIPGTQ